MLKLTIYQKGKLMIPEDNMLPEKNDNVKKNLNYSNIATMTSKQIAELTGKDHRKVNRDIKILIDQGAIDVAKIGQIFLEDSYGRNQPAYQLTKRDTLVLTSGYSAQQRAAIIDRWLELESTPKLPTGKEIAYAYIAEIEKNERLLKENDVLYVENNTQKQALEYQRPFVEHSEALRESKSLIATTQLAATQGIEVSAIILNRFLCYEGVLRRVNGTLVLTADYLDKGYGKIVAYQYKNSADEQCTSEQFRWTQEGRAFVLDLWKKRKLAEVKK